MLTEERVGSGGPGVRVLVCHLHPPGGFEKIGSQEGALTQALKEGLKRENSPFNRKAAPLDSKELYPILLAAAVPELLV